ncbi:hypothetical protein GCG54_00001317 [Colletotrichum gloeosporioides]|uniref:Uncharacterized protein n=1 Tax=Colletotrichum gloeosporioides TaxID=474922 RepID=A0A8H4FEC6_COLGL|nr:uncharacterized protein GCG54_00001317 [Colletotrichum gloeosporioides]KAF3799277.1 hypothetical protein GCG54_00001317 [Colletotrichum gloeosporioides]
MHTPTAQVEAADNAHDVLKQDLEKQPLESRFITKVSFLLALGHRLMTFREGSCHGGVMLAIFEECNWALGAAKTMYGLMKPLMHVVHSSRRNVLIFHALTCSGLVGPQAHPARTTLFGI